EVVVGQPLAVAGDRRPLLRLDRDDPVAMEGGAGALGEMRQVVAKDTRRAIGLADGEGTEEKLPARIAEGERETIARQVAQGECRLDAGDSPADDQYALRLVGMAVTCHDKNPTVAQP